MKEFMNKLIVSALCFVSFSAFACPDLQGQYINCQATSGQSYENEMTISQTVKAGVTTYQLSKQDDPTVETVVADGKTYTSAVEGDANFVLSQTAKCVKNALVINSNQKYDRQLIGDLTVTITKSGKKLTQVLKGESMMGGTLNDTLVCDLK